MSIIMDRTVYMANVYENWLDKPDTETQRRVSVLLAGIRRFCKQRCWTEGYFGKSVVGDDQFVARLSAGRVQVRRLAKAERFLREQGISEASDE